MTNIASAALEPTLAQQRRHQYDLGASMRTPQTNDLTQGLMEYHSN
jgi:hypothetical protein